jgi:hypothetical protein
LKTKAKTPVRLANGRRVTSSTCCEIDFELARYEFKWTLYFLRDLRVAHLKYTLPWLDDEQASLQFGTLLLFTLMDGTTMEIQTEDRRPECLLVSAWIINKLTRKTPIEAKDVTLSLRD